jgi:signal transduction histidine kinase
LAPQDQLAEAFRSFERAAVSLEERHRTLRARADRLEGELLDANRRLEAVLDALDSGVAVASAGGVLLRTNRALTRLGLGSAGGTLQDPELRRLASLPPGQGGTVRFQRDSPGGSRHFAAALIPAGDGSGSRVITVQDVTEVRREEEEGGRRRRLEALGRMAAELAHEVRNPLGSILLFARMLRDDLAGQERPLQQVDQILAATSGLEATVANLLAFCAPCRGALRALDMASLAADACALLAPACALRGIDLRGPSAGEPCRAAADPEAMRQVLLNLLSNALHATDSGGTIRVTARRDGARAVLTVADDGRGIAPEDLPRVFDPFFGRTEGGTGLGLSIVHRIVEQHGGRIDLESRPGRGTVARVEIPAEGPVLPGPIGEAPHD